MSNNNQNAPTSGTKSEAIVPMAWEVEPTAQQRLMQHVEFLQTAAEAMDIVLHGLDLDRRVFPDDASAAELRRRWKAQFLIVRDAYRNVAVQIDALHKAIAAADEPTS
jgi:hypothetical protein